MSNPIITKASAIQSLWEALSGLPCYEENTVPDEPTYPYLSYQLNTGGFGDSVPMVASLYYRDTKWTDANAKAEEISDRIGRGGIQVPITGGVIWVTRAQTFTQHFDEQSDKTVRRIILSVNAEYQK